MKLSLKIDALMHKLLIENDLNGFTVMEARDIWLSFDHTPSDSIEARKQVYRQILRFEKNKWLRSEGSGRTKTYYQTKVFKDQFVEPVVNIEPNVESRVPIFDYSVLINERNEYKGELEIVLGEIDEYQSILSRFPELENTLAPLHKQTKERAASLLGRVNVLTTVVKTLSSGPKRC
jgi:hypothetical protein